MTNKKIKLDVLESFSDQRGLSLKDILKSPTLMIFLRHSGCTFCREAISDLQSQRGEIESKGIKIVFVHMSKKDEDIVDLFNDYKVQDCSRISDPGKKLYEEFGLTRGSLNELLGPQVLARGFKALFEGHGIGKIDGDSLQKQGVFFVQDYRIVEEHVPKLISEKTSFLHLVRGFR